MDTKQSDMEMRILVENWREIEKTVESWLKEQHGIETQITVFQDPMRSRQGSKSVVSLLDSDGNLGVVILDHHDHPIHFMWVLDDDAPYTAI